MFVAHFLPKQISVAQALLSQRHIMESLRSPMFFSMVVNDFVRHAFSLAFYALIIGFPGTPPGICFNDQTKTF